ncbi:diguanylate cyclase [Thermotoga sp. 38H-to]|uniref:diguanylate cyclase n=1 Tax=Thermotoga sp. 38H-to TaxID=1755812 RepID=UPI0013EC22CD|nr:diguanylate cyclase [Thermotoga sp. 38H-to]KAF2960507.1 diguanylate cyclase [Thermotoga sp. 38H-to]
MRVKKFLRETYWGDEFLIEDDGEDQVLKIVRVPMDRSFFFNEYAKLKRLKLPNVLLPEKLKISDGKFLLFYPYYHNLAPLENLSEQVAKQLLRLFRFFARAGVTIPALGMDDVLVNDGVFLIPALISSVPKDVKSVVFFPEKSPQATEEVCKRFLKIHGIEPHLEDREFSFESKELRIPYIHRKEEELIKRDIEAVQKFPLFILITGEQRVGKTKLAFVLVDKLRERGYMIHQITSLEDLRVWYDASDELDLLTKLDDGQKKVILIDDLFEGSDLLSFLEEFSGLSTITKIIVLTTSTKAFQFFHKVYRLSPFTVEETRIFLERAIGKISEDQVKLIHSLSKGLPGYMVELLKFFNKSNLRENIVGILKPLLRELDSAEIRELSVLGQKFTGSELRVLEKITGKDYHDTLMSAYDSGVITTEEGLYRFALREFWKYYYNKLSENKKKNLHEKLFENLPDDLAIKHALSLEDPKLKFFYVLRYVRKHFWDYEKTRSLIEYLRRLEEFFEKPYYSIESLKMKLVFRIDPLGTEKENFHFRRFKTLGEADINSILQKGSLSYYDLYNLVVLSRFHIRAGKKAPQEILNTIKRELKEKNFSTRERLYLKAHLLYDLFSSTEDREALKEMMNIAALEGFLDLQVMGYRAFGVLSRTRAMSNYYFHHSLEISRKIDPSLSIVDESNLTWSLLYEGKITNFLVQLERLRKQARLFEDIPILSYTYFLEGLYHIYRKDFQKAEETFRTELELEEKHGIERRALRGLVINYLFSGDIEFAKRLLEKDEPEFDRFGFDFLKRLVLARDDSELLKIWKERLETPQKFFNEEIVYVFAEKLGEQDPEGFEEFLLELERENIENSSNLTLALVYETFYKFYRTLGENFKAKRYLRKAIFIYNLIGLREVSVKLEAEEKTQIEAKKPLFQLLLGFIETEKEFSDMMEFASARLSEVIPYEIFSIRIIERTTKKMMEEYSTFPITPSMEKDFLEISPFRTVMSFHLDMKYDMIVGVETNLECDEKTAWELVETLEQFGNILTTILRERLYRDKSMKDPLTGVLARWYFMERLEEEAYKSSRYKSPLSIIMCDADNFKKINDQFGHVAGDKTLGWLGRKMKSVLRKSDLVGRYGGEEFIIALPGTSLEEAKIVAEKLRKTVIEDPENTYHITLSFGVAEYKNGEDPLETIKRADEALYLAKTLGKNSVVTEKVLSRRSS